MLTSRYLSLWPTRRAAAGILVNRRVLNSQGIFRTYCRAERLKMAIFFSRSGSGSGWPILSLKVLLTSATVLSMAVLMKASVPAITDFVVCEVPSVYGSMLSWLRPPYLYIIINCIIISIVASSKLQRKIEEATLVPPANPSVVEPVKVFGDVQVENANHGNGSPSWSGSLDDERWREVENEFGGAERGSKKANDDEVEVLRPSNQTERNNSIDFSFLNMDDMEKEKKPPVSGRFPSRKSVKSNGEGTSPLKPTNLGAFINR